LNNLLWINKNRPAPEATPLPTISSDSAKPFSGVIPAAIKTQETTNETTTPKITAINIWTEIESLPIKVIVNLEHLLCQENGAKLNALSEVIWIH